MGRNSLSKTEQSKRLKQIKPEFNEVFHMFNQALLFFAARLINDSHAAQDIVTEVYLKYWEKRTEFENVYKVKAFLYISTRNACLNHNHKVNYQARIRDRVKAQADESDCIGLNESIYKDVLFLVHTIIKFELPERCKQVMLMRFFEGLELKEIAIRLKISYNTARNQMTRGIELIKKSYAFQFVKEVWDCLYENNLWHYTERINKA